MRIRANAVLAASAFVLMGASAGAQEFTPWEAPPRPNGAPEEVIVRPPPSVRERGHLGGPIIDVSMSRAIRYDDLDLNSDWGVRWLRLRVHSAALTLCKRLDAMYPIGVDGDQYPVTSSDCYRDAVADGMEQVHDAVAQARANWAPEHP